MIAGSLTRNVIARVPQVPLVSIGKRFEVVNVDVPSMGDSITEGSVSSWRKALGELVEEDEVISVIDTDKISVDVITPVAGKLVARFAAEGDTVEVGQHLFDVDTDGASAVVAEGSGDAGSAGPSVGPRGEKFVPMSRMRQTIANRLKASQAEGVLLTTFQELDMTNLMAARKKLMPVAQKEFKTKLGFMSFFMAASAKALLKYPAIGSRLEGKTIVEHPYADVSVAVATPTGLTVPVVRDVQSKSLLQIEREIASLASRAREGKLEMSDMEGGTFTISNGGVYGSLAGTPIINPPQAAILGMHGITQRAVVRDGKVVPAPVMFLALTYDHRLIDGKDAVLFLKEVTDLLENPEKMFSSGVILDSK